MSDPYPETEASRRRNAVVIAIAITAAVTTVIVTVVIIAMAGTGSTNDSAQKNASACRAYDTGLDLLSNVLSDDPPAPFAVLQATPQAKSRVTTAGQLATGKTRTAMELTATRIQALGDREQDWDRKGFNNTSEVRAVKDSIGAVSALCSRAGVTLSNVPTG